MRSLFTFLLALCATILSAQNIRSNFTARDRGWVTFGIDGGWAYQSADVRANFDGWGAGMTLAKNLAYRPGGALSLDVRGRGLFTRSYGRDWQKSFDIEDNEALNGSYYTTINYLLDKSAPNDSSYVYSNFRTGMGELGLEGVITFNRLRERTGVVFSLFGGVSGNLYRTRIDQTDDNGNRYNYFAIDNSRGKSNTLEQLSQMRDNVYESRADGSTSNGLRAGIMPGAGVELGYQLGRRFVIGAGHKITFSRTDVLDGQRWYDGGIATNDWLHYTNFYMRWDLGRVQTRMQEPRIEITEPSTDPYITRDETVYVKANIRNVTSSADVRCYLNGEVRGFEFRNGKFLTNVRLRNGRNEVRIEAFNPAGAHQEDIVLYLEDRSSNPRQPVPPPTPVPPVYPGPPPAPAPPAPEVRITTPSYSPFRTDRTDMLLRAEVSNIRDRRDIKVLVNGVSIDFTYSRAVEANVRLRDGRNIVRVEAQSDGGSASDEVVVETSGPVTPPNPPAPTGRKPFVEITQPSSVTATANEKNYTLKATVKNVNSRDEVVVLVNNQSVRDFSFSPASGELSANIILQTGSNPVVVRGRNSAGETEDRATITYTPPAPAKPTVKINDPINDARFDRSDIVFKAMTTHVAGKNEVIVVLNGTNITNFDFNHRTLEVSGALTLKEGDNTLTVRVSNSGGNAESIVRVRYQRPLPAPAVSIVSPANGSETRTPDVQLRATVKNVSSKNDINVYRNNQPVTFSFLEQSGQITASLILTEGDNTLRVTAKNSTGNHEQSVTVRYVSVKKPTVTITAPADRSRTDAAKATLVAQVTNVFSERNLKVNVNGVETSGFALDRGGRLTLPVTLKEGANTLKVSATTPDGSAEASVTVVFAPIKVNKPEIAFTQPMKPVAVSKSPYTFKAKVRYVKGVEQIEVYLNGKLQKRGISYNARQEELTFNGPLTEGKNVVRIKAVNATGTADESAELTYSPPSNAGPKPEVKIQSASQPVTNPFSPNTARTSIVAVLKNVPEKSQITITINGQALTDFNYTPATGQLMAEGNVQRGKNTVVVSAITPAGAASDTTTVTWQ